MKKEIAMKWVEALRSGKYKQGKPGEMKSTTGFCCLGVLAEISPCENKKASNEYEYPSVEVCRWSGLRSRSGGIGQGADSLATLNDRGLTYGDHRNRRFTFEEIADIIQKLWKEL